MSRMDLETAIRISAEVKGGANITKVQRSLQDLAKGSQITAREMGTLRSATFQYARANDTTIAGIRNSITAFRGLQEQVRIGGREFTRYGTEIQRLEGKLRGLDGASLGRNLAAGLAAAGVGRGLQNITAQFGRFDSELRKSAAIEGSAGSFSILKKEIEAVASVAAGTPTEVAALATAMSRAGFTADQTAQSLRGIVLGAEATDIAFADMGGIVGTILKTFQMNASQTGAVVDSLVKSANSADQTVTDVGEAMSYAAGQASALGVSVDDTLGLIALLADAGVKGSRAGTTLATGFNRIQIAAGGGDSEIQNLIRGSAKMIAAMDQLGASVLDAEGKLKPMNEVLINIKRQMQGLSTTDKAIFAKALFGEEAGRGFLAVLQRSEEDISKMIAKVNNSGGTAEKTREKMRGFGDSVKILRGNMEYLTNQIGGMIGMALKPLIDALNTVIGAAQKLPEPVKAIGSAAAAAGLLVLGLALAINTLKLSLGVVGSLRAYIATTAAAGNASAVAAGQVGTLGARLAAIGKIGTIVVGVSVVVNGISKLIEVQERLNAISNSSTEQFGAQVGGSALPRDNVDRLIKENRAEYQRRKKEFESVRFPGLTGQDEIAKAAMLQLDTRLAKLESMRDRSPRAATPASRPNAAEQAATAAAATAAATAIGERDGTGAGASTAKAKPESIGAQVAKALQQALDLTPAQASGAVGALLRESPGLNPRLNEGGAVGLPRGVGGYGAAQWTGSRQKDLIRFAGGAAGAGNLQTQLRFMVSELMGPESKALASLRKATTPEDAAVAFDRDYLRSGVKALPERKANARRVYSEIAGSGPGAGLDNFADQLKTQAQAAEAMQQQKQAADGLLATEGNRLKILQIANPLQRQIAEANIRELTIAEEYSKRIEQAKTPGGDDQVRQQTLATLQQAQQNALQANSLELERELKTISQDAMKPLQDAVQEYGNRLAYEREYGGLLKTGINPELAKQYIEIDRIAEASRTSLELQIENTQEMLAQLPIDSQLRKGLEERIKRQRELIGLIPGKVAEAKDDATETNATQDKREKDQAEAEARAERLKELYKGINSTIKEGIIGSMQAGIDSLIDGTKRLDESLKEILAGVIKDISNQLLRFAVTAGLNALGGAIGGGGGGGKGGGKLLGFDMPGQLSPNLFSGVAMPGFAGGGYTGSLPRAGGIDGQGGFPAILHPQETVIDHTRMMPVPYQATPAAAATGEQAVPYQASPAAASTGLTVPFQSGGTALTVPFLKGGGGTSGDGMEAPINVKFETVRIGSMDFVTREEAQRIGQESAQRGAELASKRYRNNPSARRRDGIR